MKRLLVVLTLLGALLAVVPAWAATPQVNITTNVLAESISIRRDNSVQIKGIITGFRVGTVASFDSLTTFIIKEPGVYNARFDIIGPDNQERAYYNAASVQAKDQNITHSILIHWPSVSFNKAGIYEIVVRVNNEKIGTFPISAN